MRLSVFIAKNLFLGCTGRPVFDDHTPEVFQKGIERQLMTAEDEKVFQSENVLWYHLGFYDDETMKFDLLDEPLLLVRCSRETGSAAVLTAPELKKIGATVPKGSKTSPP